MTLSEALNAMSTMTELELSELNRAVCSELKSRRSADSARKRFLFKAGDKVSWSGRNGYTEGTIVRVKRKKAICDVGYGRNWDVPLNMLTAA
jgi:hypothetical protein